MTRGGAPVTLNMRAHIEYGLTVIINIDGNRFSAAGIH
jgi:hypothetical protein